MVAGRPSPAPLGPVYPAGSALGGGWGLLWPYRSGVFRWCLDAVMSVMSAALEAGAFSAGCAAVPAAPADAPLPELSAWHLATAAPSVCKSLSASAAAISSTPHGEAHAVSRDR